MMRLETEGTEVAISMKSLTANLRKRENGLQIGTAIGDIILTTD